MPFPVRRAAHNYNFKDWNGKELSKGPAASVCLSRRFFWIPSRARGESCMSSSGTALAVSQNAAAVQCIPPTSGPQAVLRSISIHRPPVRRCRGHEARFCPFLLLHSKASPDPAHQDPLDGNFHRCLSSRHVNLADKSQSKCVLCVLTHQCEYKEERESEDKGIQQQQRSDRQSSHLGKIIVAVIGFLQSLQWNFSLRSLRWKFSSWGGSF